MNSLSIIYKRGNDLDLSQVIELYNKSTLGERRPVDDLAIMQSMLKNANLIITAWRGDELIGIARTLTDFDYVAYIADLAVDAAYQKRGVGKSLIDETIKALGSKCYITLLAAPKADAYYGKVGFERHPRAWTKSPNSTN